MSRLMRARSALFPILIMILFLVAGCGGNTPPQSATAVQTPTHQLSITPTATVLSEDECADVTRIPPDAPEAQAIGQAILTALTETASPLDRQHAPFEFAEIWSIDRAEDWIIVQARFNRVFEPGIFIVRETRSGFEYVGLGVGGRPANAAVIREEILQVAPDIPPVLLNCVDFSTWLS